MQADYVANSIKIIQGSTASTNDPPSDDVIVVDSCVPDFSKSPGLCVTHAPDNAHQLAKLIAACRIDMGKVKPNRHERRRQASLAKKKKGKAT